MCVHVGRCNDEKRKQERDRKPYSQTSLLCSVCALRSHALLKSAELRRRKSRLMRNCCQIEIRARIVTGSIRGNYSISTNTSLLYFLSLLHTLFLSSSHFVIEGQFRSGGWRSRLWREPGLRRVLRTARTGVTNTHTSAHTGIQYLQQNTEEMDLLSSPDATQREGKQNEDLEGKGRKDTGEDGTGVRLNTMWVQGYYSLVNKREKVDRWEFLVQLESKTLLKTQVII